MFCMVLYDIFFCMVWYGMTWYIWACPDGTGMGSVHVRASGAEVNPRGRNLERSENEGPIKNQQF